MKVLFYEIKLNQPSEASILGIYETYYNITQFRRRRGHGDSQHSNRRAQIMSDTRGEQDRDFLMGDRSVKEAFEGKLDAPPKRSSPKSTIERQTRPPDTGETGDKRGRRAPDRRPKASGHCIVQAPLCDAKNRPSATQNGDSRGDRWKETERRTNEARDAEIDLPASLPRLVSRELREQTMQTYPILREHDGHRAFFLYVMNTPNRDDGEHWGTGQPVIPWKKIARCYGKHVQDYGRNLRTLRILEMYQEQVLPDFDPSGYHSNGHARVVKDTGVAPSLEEAWREDQESDRRNADLVDFFTGKKHTPKRRHELRRDRIRACRASEPRCSDGRKWRRYLHDRDSSNYYSLLKHMPEAKAEAKKIEGKGRVQTFVNLCRIEEQPMPFYRFSENTVRLTTSRSGLQNLDSDVRDKLTQDWVKFDLSSAQLAIAAKDWGVESALDQLRSEESIWDSLKDRTGVEIKTPLKKGSYATVYGGERGTIKGRMAYAAAKEGHRMNAEAQRKFLSHPVISELLEKREARLEEIRVNGGATDCYGNSISTESIDEDSPERSVLSQLAQAREMQLLTPALELAKEVEEDYEETPWEIMLYLYDGFLVKFNTPTEGHHVPRIREAVDERCRELGYPTRLEVEG